MTVLHFTPVMDSSPSEQTVLSVAEALQITSDASGDSYVVEWEEDRTFGVIHKEDVLDVAKPVYGSRILARYGKSAFYAVVLLQSGEITIHSLVRSGSLP